MTRILFCMIALSCGLAAGDAAAQLPYLQSRSFSNYGRAGGIGPTSRPTFSPYLNLLRSGNSTLFNYYGLVRPEVEFRSANQQFQSSLGSFDRELQDSRREAAGSRLTQSGHQVRFMSDLRGPQGSLTDPQRSTVGGHSRLGMTGHSAWFGNTGVWYQPFGQTSGSSAPQQQQATGYSAPSGVGAGSPAAAFPSSNSGGRSR